LLQVATAQPADTAHTAASAEFFAPTQHTHTKSRNLYQTTHFLSGFIGLPSGQLKSLAKFSLLDIGPLILNSGGE